MINVNIKFKVESLEELQRICQNLEDKIVVQAGRSPEVTCTHPEAEDQIRNVNGNIIGEIAVKVTYDGVVEVTRCGDRFEGKVDGEVVVDGFSLAEVSEKAIKYGYRKGNIKYLGVQGPVRVLSY